MTRVMVVSDLREEGWPSMDYVSAAIEGSLARHATGEITPVRCCPPMVRRFGAISQGWGHTADRLVNRFWDYPRALRQQRDAADLFHIVDHSYAQLVHELPPDRTVVTCHDIDTFRCLTHPQAEPRSASFRAMTRRILDGFRKAARVVAVSQATRDDILAHGLAKAGAVSVVPTPPSSDFSPQPSAGDDASTIETLGPVNAGAFELLHVGSTIGRKRIDRLIDVVAGVRRQVPAVRLIRVGGSFTPEQAAQVTRLGLTDAIAVLPSLTRPQLAAVYRRAAVVVLTPDREGFGLPVVEALASGTPVVASDLPVLREVGGDAAEFCPTDSLDRWVSMLVALHDERRTSPHMWATRQANCVRRASVFSEAVFATQLLDVYQGLTHG